MQELQFDYHRVAVISITDDDPNIRLLASRSARMPPPPPLHAPPPPPFTFNDHTAECKKAINGELEKLGQLTDIRMSNMEGRTISDDICKDEDEVRSISANFRRLLKEPTSKEKGSRLDGVYKGEEGWYVVSDDAGGLLLHLDDVERHKIDILDEESNIREDKMAEARKMISRSMVDRDMVYGDACGYRFPGRVREYESDAWRYPGGQSKAQVCYGSNGSPGGDGPAYESECWFKQEVEIHNCDEFYLYKLPKVTDMDLRRSAGRFFVKVAYLDLPKMRDDDFLHRCQEPEMKISTMLEYHRWLCSEYGFGVGHGVMYGGEDWEMPCTDDLAMIFTTLPSFKVKAEGGEGVEMEIEGFQSKPYGEVFGQQIEYEFDCDRDDIRGGEKNLEGITSPVIPNDKYDTTFEYRAASTSSSAQLGDIPYDTEPKPPDDYDFGSTFTEEAGNETEADERDNAEEDEDNGIDSDAKDDDEDHVRPSLGTYGEHKGCVGLGHTKPLRRKNIPYCKYGMEDTTEILGGILTSEEKPYKISKEACDIKKADYFAGFKSAGPVIDAFWKQQVRYFTKPCLQKISGDADADASLKEHNVTDDEIPKEVRYTVRGANQVLVKNRGGNWGPVHMTSEIYKPYLLTSGVDKGFWKNIRRNVLVFSGNGDKREEKWTDDDDDGKATRKREKKKKGFPIGSDRAWIAADKDTYQSMEWNLNTEMYITGLAVQGRHTTWKKKKSGDDDDDEESGKYPFLDEKDVKCDEYAKQIKITCLEGSSRKHTAKVDTGSNGCSDKDQIKQFYFFKEGKPQVFSCAKIKIRIKSYGKHPSMRVGVLAYVKSGPDYEQSLDEQRIDSVKTDVEDVEVDDYDVEQDVDYGASVTGEQADKFKRKPRSYVQGRLTFDRPKTTERRRQDTRDTAAGLGSRDEIQVEGRDSEFLWENEKALIHSRLMYDMLAANVQVRKADGDLDYLQGGRLTQLSIQTNYKKYLKKWNSPDDDQHAGMSACRASTFFVSKNDGVYATSFLDFKPKSSKDDPSQTEVRDSVIVKNSESQQLELVGVQITPAPRNIPPIVNMMFGPDSFEGTAFKHEDEKNTPSACPGGFVVMKSYRNNINCYVPRGGKIFCYQRKVHPLAQVFKLEKQGEKKDGKQWWRMSNLLGGKTCRDNKKGMRCDGDEEDGADAMKFRFETSTQGYHEMIGGRKDKYCADTTDFEMTGAWLKKNNRARKMTCNKGEAMSWTKYKFTCASELPACPLIEGKSYVTFHKTPNKNTCAVDDEGTLRCDKKRVEAGAAFALEFNSDSYTISSPRTGRKCAVDGEEITCNEKNESSASSFDVFFHSKDMKHEIMQDVMDKTMYTLYLRTDDGGRVPCGIDGKGRFTCKENKNIVAKNFLIKCYNPPIPDEISVTVSRGDSEIFKKERLQLNKGGGRSYYSLLLPKIIRNFDEVNISLPDLAPTRKFTVSLITINHRAGKLKHGDHDAAFIREEVAQQSSEDEGYRFRAICNADANEYSKYSMKDLSAKSSDVQRSIAALFRAMEFYRSKQLDEKTTVNRIRMKIPDNPLTASVENPYGGEEGILSSRVYCEVTSTCSAMEDYWQRNYVKRKPRRQLMSDGSSEDDALLPNHRRRLHQQMLRDVNWADPYLHCYKDLGTPHVHDTDYVPGVDDVKTPSNAKSWNHEGDSGSYGHTTKQLKGVRPGATYDLSDRIIADVNENMIGLPWGYLPEYTSCAVYEDSTDDTWKNAWHPTYDDHLIELRRLYTRDLLSFCTDANKVALEKPGKCCIQGKAGRICFFISTVPGNEMAHEVDKNGVVGGRYYPKIDLKTFEGGQYYFMRARPCQFGFCTDGHDFRKKPSPPPPPPTESPFAPPAPDFPDMPPGVTLPPMPLEPSAPLLPPAPPGVSSIQPLLPSPPPLSPARPRVMEYTSKCSPLGGLDISYENVGQLGGGCEGKHELLLGLRFESCEYVHESVPGETCPGLTERCDGMQSVSTCVAKSSRQYYGDCARKRSKLTKLVGQRLGALQPIPLECEKGRALQSFKATGDTSPWYVRHANPGRFTIDAVCCPALELERCEPVQSECVLKGSYGLNGLFLRGVTGLRCNLDADEVMTGWSVTSQGCTNGKMRLQIDCCVSPHFYDKFELMEMINGTRNSTDDDLTIEEKEEIAAIAAMENGDIGTMSKSRVNDFIMSDDLIVGPLIDTMYIQEGASYVARQHVARPAGAGYKDAFDGIRRAPDDRLNADGFCNHRKVIHLDDYGSLLKSCGVNDELKANPSPLHRGNQFLRVSVRLGVGFSGEWYFQTRSHGFAGALVIEQEGIGIIATAEEVVKSKELGIHSALVGPIQLAVGTYIISSYVAYDEAGSNAASVAKTLRMEKSNRDTVFQDTITFMQHSHCKAFGFEPLDSWRLEKCGGNEDEPEDQGIGIDFQAEQRKAMLERAARRKKFTAGTMSVMPLDELDPSLFSECTDCVDEDDYSDCSCPEDFTVPCDCPIDINGKLMDKAKQPTDSARTGELADKTEADFDGAFLAVKVSLPFGGKDDDEEEEAARLGGGMTEEERRERMDKARNVTNTDAPMYFVLDAQIVFLCFEIQLFISIISGPAEIGGGIYAWFQFDWSIGNTELAYLSAELMLSPFDFSKEALADAAASPGAFVDSIHFYLGVVIRPTILNIILDFIEPVLRVVVGIILTPIILAVYIAQILLNLIIKGVEAARKLVQEAQKALGKIEKAAYATLERAKRPYYEMQNAKYMLQHYVEIRKYMDNSKCKDISYNKTIGCYQIKGKEMCSWELENREVGPDNCQFGFRDVENKKKAWRNKCCGPTGGSWLKQKMKNFFLRLMKKIRFILLKIAFTIAEILFFIVILIPKLILKIFEIALLVLEIALKVAAMAMNLILCVVLAFIDAESILDEDNVIVMKRWFGWLKTVKIIRIYELSVACEFKESELSLEANLDMVLFNKEIDIHLRFSLNFKEILKGFVDTAKSLLTTILQLFGDTVKCIDRLEKEFYKRFGNVKLSKWAALGEEPHAYAAGFHKQHRHFLARRATLLAVGEPGRHHKDPNNHVDPLSYFDLHDRHSTENHLGEYAAPDEESHALGTYIVSEHTRHAQALAAAAAYLTHGKHLDNAGREHVAAALGVPEMRIDETHDLDHWRHACLQSDNQRITETEYVAHHEPCKAAAVAAVTSCSHVQRLKESHDERKQHASFTNEDDFHPYAASHVCAKSLNTLATRECVAVRGSRCVDMVARALPCDNTCGDALKVTAERCGTFIPRMESVPPSKFAETKCVTALNAAQDACTSGMANRFCARLLEAVPDDAIHKVAGPDSHPVARRFAQWSNQNARGITPEHVCTSPGGVIDLRGNNLLGSVPACVWAQPNGATKLYLTRNMLSGTVGRLGSHVKDVHVSGNRLTGTLTEALAVANSLRELHIADNKLTGDLGAALAGKSMLRELDISGNHFVDTSDAPIVLGTVSKHATLVSYDLTNNDFNLSPVMSLGASMKDQEHNHASSHTSVHVALVLGTSISLLCPNMDEHSYHVDCGAAMHPELHKDSLLIALDCAVNRITAQAAQVEDGVWAHTSFRRERVFPFAPSAAAGGGKHSIVSYTIDIPGEADDKGESSPPTLARIEAVIAAAQRLYDVGAIARAATDASQSQSHVGSCGKGSKFLSKVRVTSVHARKGCAPGLMGPMCQYQCTQRWRRVDMMPYPFHQSIGQDFTVADPEREAQAADGDTVNELRSELVNTYAGAFHAHENGLSTDEIDAMLGLSKNSAGPSRGIQGKRRSSVSSQNNDIVQPPRNFRFQVWEGKPEEKHRKSMSLEQCSNQCRAHVYRVVAACEAWIMGDKRSAERRQKCAMTMHDMGKVTKESEMRIFLFHSETSQCSDSFYSTPYETIVPGLEIMR